MSRLSVQRANALNMRFITAAQPDNCVHLVLKILKVTYVKRPDFSISYPLVGIWRNQNYPAGTSVSVGAGVVSSESTTGTSRRKPTTRFIPPTAYTFNKYKYRKAFGRHDRRTSSTSYYKCDGCIDAVGALNTLTAFGAAGDDTWASDPIPTNALLIRCRNKMKGQDVNLAVAWAERSLTAKMLGDNATSLAKAARSLQIGQFRNAARALGIRGNPGRPRGTNWLNHWLQLQYGWKPLLSDIYGSAQALSKRPPDDWIVTAKAGAGDVANRWYSMPQNGVSTPLVDYYTYNSKSERRRFALVRIDAVPVNDLVMSFVALGLTNPLLVVWERVPYSFVVDWVTPIGSWLSSIDAMLGYGRSYTSITTFNKTIWNVQGTSRYDYTNPVCYLENDWQADKESVKLIRSVTNDVPMPTFPAVKDPGSLVHMANGLSLLAQAFGRR